MKIGIMGLRPHLAQNGGRNQYDRGRRVWAAGSRDIKRQRLCRAVRRKAFCLRQL